MAELEKILIINPYASEAGRQEAGISINDPLASGLQDIAQGRLRMTPGAAQYPGLSQQQINQLIGNQGRGGVTVKPSVSDKPNITPFPLGCPSGFFQQGDVCIPMVGTYPGGEALPAGYEKPKGLIKQAVPPEFTEREKEFYVQVFFENIGALRGKFFLRVLIPSLTIDKESTGVWIPQFSNGVLYIKILMPGNAPALQAIPAVVEISHMDEASGNKVVDDTDNVNIPAPGTATPPASCCPTGQEWDKCGCKCVPVGTITCLAVNCPSCGVTPAPPAAECYMLGGKFYCKCAVATTGSIEIGGSIFCPASCFTAGNGVRYCQCQAGTPGAVKIGTQWFCVETPTPTPQTCPTGTTGTYPNCTPIPPTPEPLPQCMTMTLSQLSYIGGKCLTYSRVGTEAHGIIRSTTTNGPCPNEYYKRVGSVHSGIIKMQKTIEAAHGNVNTYSFTFCRSPTQKDGCFMVGTDWYCPSTSQPDNTNSSASIVLTPNTSVQDGANVRIDGVGFGAKETMLIQMLTTTNPVVPGDTSKASWVNKKITTNASAETDSAGKFRVTMKAPALVSGVKGNAIILAFGGRTRKYAQKAIEVV
jgi:hypothetical protein